MLDKDVIRLARSQHGLVSRQQLIAAGWSGSRIDRARSSGWFMPILPTVSLIAPSPDTFEMRCQAIQLWLDDVGFISHRSAGRLYGLARMRRFPLQITVPAGVKRNTPPWIELRQTSWYDRDRDRTTLDAGLSVARPERMLFGLAADLGQRRFDDAADDAWNSGLVTPGAMRTYLDAHRCRGKDGVARLETWLERAVDHERPAQSYFERDLIGELTDIGLPEPVRQFPLWLPYESAMIHIDVAWPDIRLGIEPGHTRYHGSTSAIERDTQRDLACGELGWSIHRLTESARRDLRAFAHRIGTIHRQRTLDVPAGRRGPTTPHAQILRTSG